MSPKKAQPEITSIILDSIADGVFTIDNEWKITSFNKAAEIITSIDREEAIGQRCCDVFRASICETSCALRKAMESNKPVVNETVYIINASGRKIPISISAAVLRDKQGNMIGGVETFRDLSTIEELKRELEKKYTFQDIISKNEKMLRIFDILPGIAESDSTVLIEGQSGTGKEMIARAIHNLSHRKDKPIVAINCGALPDTLLESELFGYKAGAFTDAKKDKPGRIAMAEGGTLFLDEIADISPALQVKLLRVIQERTYEPLGSTEAVNANIRIIAASNKDLLRLVRKEKFRDDLYYRINVIKISLPNLRERIEDIPLLIDHFIQRFNNLKGKSIAGVSPDVLAILMNYNYPGNIRELENIIEHSFVLCKGSVIDINCLPESVRPEGVKENLPSKSFDDLEAAYLLEMLKRHQWNRTKTAAALGMHKTTLWRRMKKLNIEAPQ
jgi:PAS domain S-box-containing protein